MKNIYIDLEDGMFVSINDNDGSVLVGTKGIKQRLYLRMEGGAYPNGIVIALEIMIKNQYLNGFDVESEQYKKSLQNTVNDLFALY